MPRRLLSLLAICVLVITAGIAARTVSGTASRARAQVVGPRAAAATSSSTHKLQLGEYDGNTFPADIDAYTDKTGAKPNIVMWYANWKNPIVWPKQEAGIDARDVTPMITWSPDTTPFSMRDVAAGRYDSYIKNQARLIKAWHRTVYIRPFHEMNGTWKPYGTKFTDASSFVHGWRRMVKLFRYVGATNVKWVWAPNIYGFGYTVNFDPYYPGDAYVDWTGLDGYNSTHWWRSVTTLFKPSYDNITKLTGKPLMLAEWGCPEDGGDKAKWITDSFATITKTMPRVLATVVFDRDKETDYRIDSSSRTLSAYRGVVGTYNK